MSIRYKTSLVSILTLLLLFVLLYVALQSLLLNSYKTLEERSVQDNIERAANTIGNRLDRLNATAGDWAYWDDTYSFIQGNNHGYIESNLMDNALVTLDVNMMIFVNETGTVIYKKVVDLHTGQETTFPINLMTALIQQRRSLDPNNPSASVKGFVQSGDTVIMVAMRHILTSRIEGPSAGILIVGKYLDQDQMAAFSTSLNLSLTIHPLEDVTGLNELHAAAPVLASNLTTVSQPLDDKTIAGYTLLKDLQGNPVRILELTMERSIYAQGQIAVRYFVITILIIGAVFTVVMLGLIDRIVLIRLTQLTKTVTYMRDTGDVSAQIAVTGQDELAKLASIFDETMHVLGHTRDELKRANANLEDQVAARTFELEHVNVQLRNEIVEHKETQNELKKARDQALEALRLKTQILANVSHDARTPLSVISLRAEMMQSGRYGPVTDKQRDIMNSILVNVRQLVSFIENLLSGSQIDHDKLIIKSQEVSPSQLLVSIPETLQPLAERKGLELSWSVAPDVPAEMTVDQHRFDQILQNLVNNAIKFTTTGSIQVRIYLPDTQHWALEVADTGIGIPPAAQSRIFEAFWQVDGSLTRAANRGVGLGLSIVKQLTTLMNGRVTVESELNKGSTFTITFPLPETQGAFTNGTTARIGG